MEESIHAIILAKYFICLFEALRPGQQFFSYFGTASWAQPVQYLAIGMNYLAQGHNTTSLNLAIKSLMLSKLSYLLPMLNMLSS